jgi:glyoxylase-like metal-dependent hydrolase (beta-lactamase superfamily II)
MKIWISLFVSFLAGSLFAQGRNFDSVEYVTTDLGHGIYMLEGSGGNIGVSIGEDGVFLIDDQFAPLSEKLLAAIGELSDLPVRFVVNTHWHGDHVGGNENMAKQGAIIMAHDNVRARMAAPGRRQSPEKALPIITFSDTNTYHLNGHKIHAFHVHHAHTDGDSIIHFEDVNIIHAGDIMFNGIYPFIDLNSGGSVDGFIAALERLAAIANDETVIIAGHGPIASVKDVIASMKMIRSAKAKVAALVKQGKSLEEVQQADPLSDYHADWSWSFINGKRFTEILYTDLTD